MRPPNNNNFTSNSGQYLAPMLPYTNQSQSPQLNQSGKIVYTHDGRPIRRKSKRQAPPISGWMLRKRLGGGGGSQVFGSSDELASGEPRFAIQLHHFQCQATQVTPRPVIVLTVKRNADAIAQYLHESSTTSIRPYQVNHADYFESSASFAAEASSQASLLSPPLLSSGGPTAPATLNGNTTGSGETTNDGQRQDQLLVTLYDITVSATVALNVSLLQPQQLAISGQSQLDSAGQRWAVEQEQPGVHTVLGFRRGQRMSFECHLEITGTEFEQRKRININEEGK